ncbi:MAG: T9SS type A sorting domain-containing protein [Saprospiraceae bacterium]|nr:T9SS type A sorting domain-containing protein [Saprospiraceae bacterium]
MKYTSGLDEAESVTQLLIYPNPTAHLANLELNSLKTLSPAWLDLFDAAGRKIKSFNILQKTGDFTWQIPLDVLASGCYLLCLRNKTGEIIGLGRFVKH